MTYTIKLRGIRLLKRSPKSMSIFSLVEPCFERRKDLTTIDNWFETGFDMSSNKTNLPYPFKPVKYKMYATEVG